MKKYKISLLVVAVFMFSLFSSTAFAVPDDSIVSQHIKEADGTTGQDTNTGSGIKTGHIQDGAVTPAKMGFYSNVIIVAPSGGDFTSPVDAMNAITDASATNPYLVKIMPGIYDIGLNMLYMKSFVDMEGSGESVTIIIGGNWAVVHGASHAEIRLLTVRSTCQTPCSGNSARAIHNEAVSDMRIIQATAELTKTCGCGGLGIYNMSDSSIMLSGVTVRASGSNDVYGIVNFWNVSATMNNVTINSVSTDLYWRSGGLEVLTNSQVTVNGGKIFSSGNAVKSGDNHFVQPVVLNDVTAEGSCGVAIENATVYVNNSRIIGAMTTCSVGSYAGSSIRVGNSQLQGGPADAAYTTCAGVYDENYVFYANTCP